MKAMNQISRLFCLGFIGSCVAFLLCSCSEFTLEEHLKTRDEALTYFFDNKNEFESLRDMMVLEKATRFTVYASENCSADDQAGDSLSSEHMRVYYAKLKKLGLRNASKTFIDTKYPIVDFCVSAVGFLDIGRHSVTIYFTKGRAARLGEPSKITADGWCIASD